MVPRPSPTMVSSPSPSPSSCCEIIFSGCLWRYLDSDFTRWYKIKVPVNEIAEIYPFWEGHVTKGSSFAAVGDYIYSLGGEVRYDRELGLLKKNSLSVEI